MKHNFISDIGEKMENKENLYYHHLTPGEHEALIIRTQVLLKMIFLCEEVEVVLYSERPETSLENIRGKYRFPIRNSFNSVIGHVDLVGPKSWEFTERDVAIAELVMDSFNFQLQLIARCVTVGIKGGLIEKENYKHQLELEDAYAELNLAHEELSNLFNQTFTLNASLNEAMDKRMSLLDDAPIAVGILRGRELRIAYANNFILEVWGKSRSIVGGTLVEGLPELLGQPYLEILDTVFMTGKRYIGREAKVKLEKEGEIQDCWFNFYYEPISIIGGDTDGIIIIANEVTDLLRRV